MNSHWKQLCSAYPVLSHEEQWDLLRDRDSKQSRDKLINHSVGLSLKSAAWITKNKKGGRRSDNWFDDLVQVGIEGLIHAVGKFDLSRIGEIRFCTYAMWWIRQRQVRYLHEHTHPMVRLPIHVSAESEIFDRIYGYKHIKERDERAYTVRHDCEFESVDVKDMIERHLRHHPRLLRLVRKYYWEQKTLVVIGNEEGVTRERVRQLLQRAYQIIRSAMVAGERQAFLEFIEDE